MFENNVSFPTNASNLFYDYVSLSSISGNVDTSKVTTMDGMFTFADKISSLKLGPKSILREDADIITAGYDFDTDSYKPNYTGRWIDLKTGNTYSSSNALLKKYNGKNPGTYVQETGKAPSNGLAQITVKNSTIYVGDSWKPSDNFVSATEQYGKPLTFDKIVTFESVPTSYSGESK